MGGGRAVPPVFPIACWALGMAGFCQLLVAGLALAERLEVSRVVRVVEKEVVKLVPVRVPTPAEAAPRLAADAAETGGGVALQVRGMSRIDDGGGVAEPAVVEGPPPAPILAPGIVDPRAERLVMEARRARVGGDMGLAILKLEEATKTSPDEPHVHYEMGLVHEAMGVFDMAAEDYLRVMDLGISRAGSLYEAAAAKVRDGFAQPGDMLGKLSLERVRVFEDPEHEAGKRVVLTIPVLKAPGEEIDPQQMQLTVVLFNRNHRGEIVRLEDRSWLTERWLAEPADWADGEERLRVDYLIPRQDDSTAHLFGELDYYGQVVMLEYGGEVLDVQSWPRDLAARLPNLVTPAADGMQFPEFLDMDLLPPDFDPNLPLLPPR
jgi:hypothetical protein